MTEQSHDSLAAIADRLDRRRVLVVGDLILDRYLHGRADRINPEGPGVVFQVDETIDRLGGAAAVAALLAALGCEVGLAGVEGNDAEGESIRRLLFEAHVGQGFLVRDGRPQTVKVRRVVQGQLLPDRTDWDYAARLIADCEDRILKAIEAGGTWDAIAIADYGRGVCDGGLPRSVIFHARGHEPAVPVLVDPHHRQDWKKYRGATVLKCNQAEHEANGQFFERFGIPHLIVTQGRKGLFLDGRLVASPTRRQVKDVAGAGDTVLAVLAAATANGLDPADACQLANVAAGMQVERLGVQPIPAADLAAECGRLDRIQAGEEELPASSKIVTLDQAQMAAAAARDRGEVVVFTNGCFAALHAGHMETIRAAARLGDTLIVAINSAESIRRIKGARPVINDLTRGQMLATLPEVHHVLITDDDTPDQLLWAIRPDVLAKGGTTDEIVGREFVEGYGGRVVRLAKLPGVSTTALDAQLAE